MTGSGLGTGALAALTGGESRRNVGSGVSVWLMGGRPGLGESVRAQRGRWRSSTGVQ